MVLHVSTDLESLIAKHMASGQYASEDELLRCALESLQDDDEAAVREAIAAWQAGDEGIPLDEAFNEIRRRHGLEPRP